MAKGIAITGAGCGTLLVLLALLASAFWSENRLLPQTFPRPAAKEAAQAGKLQPVVYSFYTASPAAAAFEPAPTVTPSFTPLPPPVPATPTPTPTPTAVSPPLPTVTPLPPAPEPALPAQLTAASGAPAQIATRLVIPALNLDAPVILAPVQGDTWRVDHLDQAVGHLERTASPGDNSNVVLAGHVTLEPDGRSGPFAGLGKLAPGDAVIVYRDEQSFTYRVDYITTVKPTNVEVTYPSPEPKLTLITCLNYNRSAGRYTDRLVVVGHLLGRQEQN